MFKSMFPLRYSRRLPRTLVIRRLRDVMRRHGLELQEKKRTSFNGFNVDQLRDVANGFFGKKAPLLSKRTTAVLGQQVPLVRYTFRGGRKRVEVLLAARNNYPVLGAWVWTEGVVYVGGMVTIRCSGHRAMNSLDSDVRVAFDVIPR